MPVAVTEGVAVKVGDEVGVFVNVAEAVAVVVADGVTVNVNVFV